VFIPPAYAIIEDWMAFLKRLPTLNRFITSMESTQTETETEAIEAGK
jgi:hypothetical protein